MASQTVVLDTDVWSHIFGRRGRRTHPKVPDWKRRLAGRAVVVATQTREEVIAGVRGAGWASHHAEQVLQQLDRTPTIPVDERLIQRYADLTVDAKARGDALGGKPHTGDRWIAATALALGAPLFSLDRIFRSDPQLMLWHGDD